ncbi:MAG: hypothetical protein JW863_12350 [Chitinispirillaceae bacterium]|nr:hypothetical protein [Chitinispirillaceae bacterium]
MKYGMILVMLAVSVFCRTAMGDTLSLVGGLSGNFATGWWGEAWTGEHWCGDTLLKDTSPDTVYSVPDTIKDLEITTQISDTTIITQSAQTVDSLLITTKSIQSRVVVRDSADDPVVDVINSVTTITDSSIIASCVDADFIADTGAATEGAKYFDFYYKFRNYYAQLPFVWNGWAGLDSITVTPYTKLLVTYKGLLPVHQIQMSFFYATWGTIADTMKTFLKLGDGLGTLTASPDEWKTVVLDIPDSVTLPGITGISLSIENVPNGGGADTSEVGNLKVQEISLFYEGIGTTKERFARGIRQDRYHFTPKAAGNVAVSVYSLKGTLLRSVTVKVDPSRNYSLHQLGSLGNKTTSEQIRIVKVRGAGVNMSEKIW